MKTRLIFESTLHIVSPHLPVHPWRIHLNDDACDDFVFSSSVVDVDENKDEMKREDEF